MQLSGSFGVEKVKMNGRNPLTGLSGLQQGRLKKVAAEVRAAVAIPLRG